MSKGYTSYRSVTLATGISDESMLEIEERNNENLLQIFSIMKFQFEEFQKLSMKVMDMIILNLTKYLRELQIKNLKLSSFIIH